MIKATDNSAMNGGLIVFMAVLVFVFLSPLLTRAGDLDDRDRRGWWSNH
jgi:hypothetical protein